MFPVSIMKGGSFLVSPVRRNWREKRGSKREIGEAV